MKTRDHYWTDPPADELVQRHRISSGASTGATSPANRRPGLHVNFFNDCTVVSLYSTFDVKDNYVSSSWFSSIGSFYPEEVAATVTRLVPLAAAISSLIPQPKITWNRFIKTTRWCYSMGKTTFSSYR